jgi:N utilization substance protein B
LKRRKSREIVLKSLYEIENSKKNLDEILKKIENIVDISIKNFAKELFLKTFENIEKIDEIISESSHKWKIERIASVDRNILRIAISEIIFFPDIPYKVSINEAIELAKKFGSEENSKKFINGILSGVVKKLGIENSK